MPVDRWYQKGHSPRPLSRMIVTFMPWARVGPGACERVFDVPDASVPLGRPGDPEVYMTYATSSAEPSVPRAWAGDGHPLRPGEIDDGDRPGRRPSFVGREQRHCAAVLHHEQVAIR